MKPDMFKSSWKGMRLATPSILIILLKQVLKNPHWMPLQNINDYS